jgi:uncharacterized OB-fold protein
VALQPISDHSYEKFLNEEELMGSKCNSCDALFVPPRARCVDCHSTELAWVAMKGTGKLAAFTCIAIGPPSMIEQGYDRNNPYCCGVIDLAEGPRVVARIEGVDTLLPESIKIGMPLKAKYLHRQSDASMATTLAFTPID